MLGAPLEGVTWKRVTKQTRSLERILSSAADEIWFRCFVSAQLLASQNGQNGKTAKVVTALKEL